MARTAIGRTKGMRPARFAAPVAIQLRRLRTDRAPIGIVVAVVLVTSFVFAAIPGLFNDMADDGLRAAVDGSRSFLRNIGMARAMRISPNPGEDLYAEIHAEGARFQETLAPSIQAIIGGRSFVFDSPRYIFLDLPGAPRYPSPRYFNLRQGDGIESRLTLVDGRMPAATDELLPVPFDIGQTNARLFEVAVSPETARQIGARLGDRFWMMPDPSDGIVRRQPTRNLQYIACEIVGFIEVNDVRDPWWFADVRLDRAIEYDDGTRVHFYATALIAKEAYPALLEATTPMPIAYQWRYFTDTRRFDASDLDQLAEDVRRLDAEYPPTGLAPPTDTTVRTGLSAIFRRFQAQLGLTEAILSLSSIGLLAVALAVIGLVAALIAERRRDQTALIRGRGGSRGQIVVAQLVEGLALALPAGAAGLLAAVLLVGNRASMLSPLLALGIALATALLLVVFLWPFVQRPLRVVERADIVAARLSPRRIAVEAGVVALALAGVYLLRRRGLSADTSARDVGGFDPYLAAVPILVGLATGLVVLRLYPLPIRLLAWATSLRRDLVPSLGFRRVARQPSIHAAPLLVLLLAVAVGVFSSVLLHSIDQGQIATSWQTVGAAYRVDAAPANALYRGVDLTVVDEVEAVAPAFAESGFSLVSNTPVFGLVNLLAVDTRALTEVNAATPAEPDFPRSMLAEAFPPTAGSPASPIPAIVSANWVFNRVPQPGDTFAVNIYGYEVSFIVAEVRTSFPTLTDRQSFVVAPLGAILAGPDPPPLYVNRQYLRAPDGALEELRATLERQSISASLTSRREEYDRVHRSPLIAGAASGFRIGVAIAAAYSALAVAVALALTARARGRDLAYLRTLGLSDRQVLGLVVVEQAPPVAIALIVGAGLGVATVRLIEPGIDLTAFTGPGFAVPVRVDYGTIAAMSFGLVIVVAAAIGVASRLAQRANLGAALRLGEE